LGGVLVGTIGGITIRGANQWVISLITLSHCMMLLHTINTYAD